MSATHRIAVIPGDGIGTEVVPEGLRVLDAAAAAFDLNFDFEHFDHSSAEYYSQHGKMLPDNWFDELRGFDAIFFGAVGWPEVVPDHISLWGSLLQFRRAFDQYVNLRPVRLMPGVRSPLAGRQPGDVDFYVVRENTEGEYSSIGGKMFEGTDREIVMQETVMTRTGVDRILKFAFDLAAEPTQEAPDLGHQEQRHLDHHAVLGRTRRRRWPPTTPTSTWTSTTSTSSRRTSSCTPTGSTSSSASNLFGDILSDLGPGVHRHHRHRAQRQHQSRARLSQSVRTRARIRARHRRPRDRQPHRPDLVRLHDAGAPRRTRRRRRSLRGHRDRPGPRR